MKSIKGSLPGGEQGDKKQRSESGGGNGKYPIHCTSHAMFTLTLHLSEEFLSEAQGHIKSHQLLYDHMVISIQSHFHLKPKTKSPPVLFT